MSDQDPFADMEVEWEKVEKAKPGMAAGRLPIHHAYHGVIVAFDDGQGNMVDHLLLTPAGKNPGVKIAIEILEPEKIEDETVKGRTHEHVFWISGPSEVSQGTWSFVKRDVETITGVNPSKPQELLKMVWAGRTLEFGLKDDNYGGTIRSKVTHINAWAPEKAGEKKNESKTENKKTESKASTQKTQSAGQKGTGSASNAQKAAAEGKSSVDF